MDTPSLVIVGAPHFFSSTTLRPLGPRVTFTLSASWLSPRSMPRRASSSKAIIFAIGVDPPLVAWQGRPVPATDGRRPGGHVPPARTDLTGSAQKYCHSPLESANPILALSALEIGRA